MKRKLFKLIIKARGHKCAYMKARARRVMRNAPNLAYGLE